MAIFLETERLVLKIPCLEDYENSYQLQSDPDVMRYVGQGVRTGDEVLMWLKKAIAHYRKHTFSFGSVFEKDTGAFVGRSGIIYLGYDDTQPDIEFGYVLHKNFWGKGYATELAKALVSWSFANLPIKKLIGITYPENTASCHVLEKAGLHYVDTMMYGNKLAARYEIQKK